MRSNVSPALIHKVKALWLLAERTNFPEEAKSARRKVCHLMARYGIRAEDLEAKAEPQPASAPVYQYPVTVVYQYTTTMSGNQATGWYVRVG